MSNPALRNDQMPIKILLIGSFGVGKTNILHVLLKPEGYNEATPPTLRLEFASLRFPTDDPTSSDTIPVTMWDTVGQERYCLRLDSLYCAQ